MSKEQNNLQKTVTGRVAIVTGGTRGIGLAVARALLEAGAKVGICGRSRSSVDSAVNELSPVAAEFGGSLFGDVADISQCSQVERFVSSVAAHFGGVDILINNAGFGIFKSVEALTPEEWDRMIALNLSGPYYCSHAVLPIFKQRGGGDVINISSLAGKNPFAGGAGYNASKFGLNGFSEAMMLDHRLDNVRVSYVMPGSVDTEFSGSKGDQASDWKIEPEDIADVVMMMLRMPQRTLVSRVEVRPSKPGK